MSRNSEKAQSMLFRFREQQAAEMGIIDRGRDRRPRDIRSVKTIPDCERWRSQVVREISRKITRIHEPSVSEPQIHDLNDEINKLMREKHVWELQLKDLGGPNYIRFGGATSNFGSDKDRTTSTRGYQYYGRARDLPGVKELFEAKANQKSALQESKKKDTHVPKDIPASYYGLDDEDPQMLKEEEEAEKALEGRDDYWADEQRVSFPGDEFSFQPLPEMNAIPSPADVEKYLIERKRQKLQQLYLD